MAQDENAGGPKAGDPAVSARADFARPADRGAAVPKVSHFITNKYMFNIHVSSFVVRHRVYDYQVYPIGMSDMRLIDNRVSTTWCQVCLLETDY